MLPLLKKGNTDRAESPTKNPHPHPFAEKSAIFHELAFTNGKRSANSRPKLLSCGFT
jgi:hypothetical protein